ncbi:TRAP transporter small permease [Burkholderiaceae bacterium FT117]|uniref:TRAP transporter small permease n=1 Tax=Zeimonas sediminis TaxID=2944268 RepID=UPI0023430B2A|nr:TRAP transporter small permease [Zeimonas sediminis]MCM5572298.1 TRAP transporter small permease [Zeimonas sediminis]
MPDPDRNAAPDPTAPADQADPPRRRYLPEDLVGALAMALLTAITFGNVLVRYFTSESFAWTEEISVWLMVVVTMVGAGAAVVRDRHIRVEVFYLGGTATRRSRLSAFSSLATVAVFLLLFGLGLRLFWDDYRYEVTSPGIGVPQWWYTIWLPLLSLAIAIRAMHRLIRESRPS